jgi:Recombinase/Recombinase zinc beta ribbon domain
VIDPDVGVQHALRHLFTTFARTGSARATVQAFRDEGLLFPARVRTGPHKGEVTWMPLKHWRVLRTLHNPRYAGAFAYGQSRTRKTADGRITFEKLPRDQWTALIPDAHPGYVSWEQFETNQQLLAANAAAHARDHDRGPAREGPALLQGLAVCGRCGKKMTVAYHRRGAVEVLDYRCMRKAIDTGSPVCHTVPGATIDPAIGQLLLDTVTPLSLKVALSVQAELEARADEADA